MAFNERSFLQGRGGKSPRTSWTWGMYPSQKLHVFSTSRNSHSLTCYQAWDQDKDIFILNVRAMRYWLALLAVSLPFLASPGWFKVSSIKTLSLVAMGMSYPDVRDALYMKMDSPEDIGTLGLFASFFGFVLFFSLHTTRDLVSICCSFFTFWCNWNFLILMQMKLLKKRAFDNNSPKFACMGKYGKLSPICHCSVIDRAWHQFFEACRAGMLMLRYKIGCFCCWMMNNSGTSNTGIGWINPYVLYKVILQGRIWFNSSFSRKDFFL